MPRTFVIALILTALLTTFSVTNAVLASIPSNSTYHTDHLGSNIALTDATSTVVWDQGYLPFGERHGVGISSVSNLRQYTGKELDEDTGLYYYGARYYHPELGRFMSVDPAPGVLTDPQSWNRYAYVQNSPFKYVDPDGEFLETAWDAFNITLGVISLKQNLTQGNYLDAAIDAGGILVDSAAAITPFVPGGVATAVKASRFGRLGFSSQRTIFFSLVARQSTIDTIIKSANRPRGQTTELLRALDKKLNDRQLLSKGFQSAFEGVERNSDSVNRVLKEILEKGEVTRAGNKTIDVFLGNRGIRFERDTNKFIGFLEKVLERNKP